MTMPPVPCAHIADYYDDQQRQNKSIGNNLLRHGYRQWAEGRVSDDCFPNNLFGPAQVTRF